MNRITTLVLIISTISCGTHPIDKIEVDAGVDVVNTQHKIDRKEFAPEVSADTIILYEDRIKNIELPFGQREMLTELKKGICRTHSYQRRWAAGWP